MITKRTWSNLPPAMMMLPIVLGVSLCYLRPEGAWLWVIAMLFLPVSWLGIKAASKAAGRMTVGAMLLPPGNSVDAREAICFAMNIASLIVAIPLGAKLANALGLIDQSFADVIATRWTNVLAGGYFVFRGNRLPKILVPLSDLPQDSAAVDTLRRRTGWAYVVAGFAMAAVWLVLLVRLAQPVGIAIVAVGILVPTFMLRSRAKRRTALLNH
jgi:hypothetical protein